MYLLIHPPFVHPLLSPPESLSTIHPSNLIIHLSPADPPTHSSIHPFTHSPTTHSSIIHPPIHSSSHPLIHPSSVHLFICPSIHPLTHPSAHPSIHILIHQITPPFFLHPSTDLPIYLLHCLYTPPLTHPSIHPPAPFLSVVYLPSIPVFSHALLWLLLNADSMTGFLGASFSASLELAGPCWHRARSLHFLCAEWLRLQRALLLASQRQPNRKGASSISEGFVPDHAVNTAVVSVKSPDTSMDI